MEKNKRRRHVSRRLIESSQIAKEKKKEKQSVSEYHPDSLYSTKEGEEQNKKAHKHEIDWDREMH